MSWDWTIEGNPLLQSEGIVVSSPLSDLIGPCSQAGPRLVHADLGGCRLEDVAIRRPLWVSRATGRESGRPGRATPRASADRTRPGGTKIGRASCRERGESWAE